MIIAYVLLQAVGQQSEIDSMNAKVDDLWTQIYIQQDPAYPARIKLLKLMENGDRIPQELMTTAGYQKYIDWADGSGGE